MPLDRSVGNYFDNTNAHLVRVARWTGPASYATGGEDVSPSVFGLGKIVALLAAVITDGTTVRIGAWNITTNRLEWIVPSTNAEVANTTNLSTFTGSLVVFGN
jgi:hypothetical protein